MNRASARLGRAVRAVGAAPAACVVLALLSGCAPSRPKAPAASASPAEVSKSEPRADQKAFIAHEFFLRARQQEMDGNDAVALSYYQIAFEYDATSRDLCFILIDKLKTAGKMDSALAVGMRCLDLKGTPTSSEFQTVAEIHLRKGDIQKALIYYNRALDLDDGDKDLLYTLATLYESLKDVKKHVDVMDRLLPRIDYPVRLVEKQGQNLRALGRVDAVAQLYRSAWSKSGNPLFGEKLASFYEDQEMYASLLEVLRKLAGENPDNLHYELQRARALLLAGRPDSALATYEGLLKKSPDEREFLGPYATLLYEKGRYGEAKEIFQRLLKGQPNNPIHHFFLGSIGMEMGDKALAESALRKAIDLDAKVPEYWAKLASFHIREGQEQKAVDLLADLENKGEGRDWYSLYVQGIVYTQVGKKLEANLRSTGGLREAVNGAAAPAQADTDTSAASRARRYREQGVEHYREALALEGNNRRVLFELGVSLEQLGRRQESIDVMKRLVKLDSGDATILNYLGYMLVEEDRELDLAGALIDRALALEPENGAFLDSKGWWFYRKKDFPNARKYIEMALERIPKDTTILEHCALILEKLGQSDAAMEMWRQILKLDPGHDLAHRRVPS
ncbi:MAG TPA: tetratricopeptide repeat protein, partial [Fibrobacteria bacterium]|nr:tetratricopeptide repeat protein [Fibrobacteria bacterium]